MWLQYYPIHAWKLFNMLLLTLQFDLFRFNQKLDSYLYKLCLKIFFRSTEMYFNTGTYTHIESIVNILLKKAQTLAGCHHGDATDIIQWTVIEAHRYDNVIKTFGVYMRQKISTVIYLRAVIFVCLLAYLLTLGMFLILTPLVWVCVPTISRFFFFSFVAAFSSYYFSPILIINYWVLFFFFSFSVAIPKSRTKQNYFVCTL